MRFLREERTRARAQNKICQSSSRALECWSCAWRRRPSIGLGEKGGNPRGAFAQKDLRQKIANHRHALLNVALMAASDSTLPPWAKI